MNNAFNGNGGGNGASSVIHQVGKRPAPPPPPPSEMTETPVVYQNSDGATVRSMLVRVTRHTVVFEIYNPGVIPRLSEALNDFKIVLQGRTVFSGRVVVSNLMEAGSKIICEAVLDEGGWQYHDPKALARVDGLAAAEFRTFVREWQKLYKLSSEFKLAVADMQNFLHDLRLWLDQIEAGTRSLTEPERLEVEIEIARKLQPSINPALNKMFERFEIEAAKIAPDAIPEHRMFCHRQLHPLLLCSPFMYRIFAKPLGYAGDYEMIDMIIRNEYEGDSLFAKVLQAYILEADPARSVRNRVDYFVKRFIEETSRVSLQKRPASFFTLGCGPAREIEKFLSEHALSDLTQFRLLDFNEETLERTGGKLQRLKQKLGRKTPVNTVKKSVNQLLKESEKSAGRSEGFDLIYCSGLYDYLSDRVCRQLNTHLYDQLRPGGMLVVTNFDPCNPIRNIMEYIFEWFLIHRDSRQLIELSPEQASPEDCRVVADATGCNVFLEARKPA